jgi:threonine 3-dehydrogenase
VAIMKAVVKVRPQNGGEWPRGLELVDRPVPDIQHPDDVKILVRSAGVCGSDVGISNSKESFRDAIAHCQGNSVIIGHEFCGSIVDAGEQARVTLASIIERQALHDSEVAEFARGRNTGELARDRRLVEFVEDQYYCSAEMHITCGWCYQCRLGDRHVCQNTRIKGLHEDGAFADFLVVPASNLVLFRKGEIPEQIIAFMDALGNAVHTVGEVDLAGRSVAILGAGVQGLMATALARRSGASRIYVTDFTPPSAPERAAHLEESLFGLARKFGASHCFDLGLDEGPEKLRRTINEETEGTGVDVVLEMSGNYGAYRDGFDIIRMGGTMAILGIPAGEMKLDFARDIIFQGLTVKGIIGRRVFGTWETMRNLLRAGLADELLESGIVSHELPLADYEKGIDAIMKRDAIKVILNP